ncbi:oligosaccharide flippase family protein [Shewanella basaltis]|nr:oligosaccharide flippase family protein [Shewanella basaltis]
MFGKYLVYITNFMSLIILSRLFTPEDFGVIAIISFFYLMFQMFSEAGIGPAIINLNNLSVKSKNGIFTFTLLVGLFSSITFYLFGSTLSSFFNQDKLLQAMPFLSIGIMFFSFLVVPLAFLQREQKFIKIAKAGVISECTSVFVIFIMYDSFDSVSTLASRLAVIPIVNFIILYYFSASTEFKRPCVGFYVSEIKLLFKFSLYQFLFSFLNFLSRNFDNLLVGKYLGSVSLGVYDKAYHLMKYPLMLLTYAMNPAIQPVISKISNNREEVQSVHLKFCYKISIISSLVGFIFFVFSKEIVYIVLGEQWGQVAVLLQIFSLSIPVQCILSSSGGFFQALNEVKLMFKYGLFSVFTFLSSMFLGLYLGELATLATSLVFAFFINFLVCYFLMYKYVYCESVFLFYIKTLSPIFLFWLLCFNVKVVL